MAKKYKNVYTILEKVKKGEIKSYYKDNDGLFGRISFYKKPDLIKPYLHYLDEERLQSILDHHLSSRDTAAQVYKIVSKEDAFIKANRAAAQQTDGSRLNIDSFYKKFYENFEKFPKHIAKDIFKMFYNKMEKLEFEERTPGNHAKFKFLEKANNPTSKIMTESSNLKSAIFTRNIISYFVGRMTALEFTDPTAAQDLQKGLNAGNDFDNTGVDDALDKMLGSTAGKNMLENMLQKAQDLCKTMDGAMDEDIQEKMFEQANDEKNGKSEAAKLSPDYIKTVARSLANIKMSMGNLKEKIKKLLDKSASYFSSKTKTIYDDIFNSDNISELQEFELLHPNIRNLFLEDITIKETKSVGKIDLYIDVSGSMDSSCGIDDQDGNSISKINFAKSFAAKLKEMNILNDIYLFDTRVKKYRTDIVSISMISSGGGTNINEAVRSIENNKVNALVITDAEDRCGIYSDRAFFIGIKGARFDHFEEVALQKYGENGQIVIFDGTKIQNITGVKDLV